MPSHINSLLCLLVVVLVTAIAAGCRNDGISNGPSLRERDMIIARIKVSRSGQIDLNGMQVTREQLRTALTSLKDVNGTVWYYREGGADFPSEEAEKVFDTILDAKLPVRVSCKPDFSDSMGPEGICTPVR